MNDQPERTPEEELAHWRTELARVLKANPTLPWPNLIEWAEEAEHWAIKTATRSGRANLAGLGKQLDDAQRHIKTLTEQRNQLNDDINVYRAEIHKLQDQLDTAAYDRTWPHDRTRPADVQREVDKAVAQERHSTTTVTNQYKAAQARWQRDREELVKRTVQTLASDCTRFRSVVLAEVWEALRDAKGGPLIDGMGIVNDLLDKKPEATT